MNYTLPAHARPFVGRMVIGTKWDLAERIEGLNRYHGLVNNSAQFFRINNVLLYEAKADVDADGSDGKIGNDTWQGDTSLHTADNRPFSAISFPFAVIPGQTSLAGAMDIQDLGLKLGDLGVAIYNGVICPFIYADYGPKHKIGEISRKLAQQLGINDNPNTGGLQNVPPGVVYVNFIGSGNVHHGQTNDTAQMYITRAMNLWQRFTANGKVA